MQTEAKFLEDYNIHDFEVPLVSVDMAIFAIEKVIDDCAYRKLKEKTGIVSPYLEQVETIGSNTRDPRGWSVTSLYFALIDKEKVVSKGKQKTQWLSVANLKKKKLAFDHKQLAKKAICRLRAKSRYTALPVELLPEEFTLTELQRIFEVILGRELPAKSFRRRMQTAEVVEATGKSKISGKRSAQLYRSTGKDRDYYFPRPLEN